MGRRVSARERSIAQKQANAIERVSQPGESATLVDFAKLRKAVTNIWIRRNTVVDVGQALTRVINRTFRQIQPELRDGLTVANSAGLVVVQEAVTRNAADLVLSAYTGALKTARSLTSPRVVRNLREFYDEFSIEFLQDSSAKLDRELRTFFADLTEQQVTTRDGVRLLNDKFNRLGITPSSPHLVETIFRTQTQLAYSSGLWNSTQNDPDIQEILWGYKYVTVGDDRVRDSHADIDGTILPQDHLLWQTIWPPNGWNCRCQAIPIFNERNVQIPSADFEPDEGFAFNSGELFAAAI